MLSFPLVIIALALSASARTVPTTEAKSTAKTTTSTTKTTTSTKPTTTTTTTTTTSSAAPTSTATAGPPGFNITSLTVNGSGCPPGSADYTLSPDNTAVTVTFSEFDASAGPGIAISENRKNCQLTLTVGVPAGFTFGVANVDYRGWYELDSQVTANQMSTYYFQGQLQEATAHSNFTGVLSGDDYTFRDSFNVTSTNMSPCGVSTVLNINSALQVSNSANSQGSGYIADDSIDASLITTFNFQWQTC